MAKDSARTHKEWEAPLIDLEDNLTKLREMARKESNADRKLEIEHRVAEFQTRRDRYVDAMYANLGPWEKVLVARAEKRPYTLDYVQQIFSRFVELDGDRLGFRDHVIIGGPCFLDGRAVMVVGHQKGRTIQDRQFRNFGMAKPEGYRKAIRLFDMADRFKLPVITFLDTPAADPGVESESRGISEAIAASMLRMFELTVPVVSVVIGEGGSGGAIGIGIGNRVLMLEHSIYSVIPPEGCAAILWRNAEMGAEAAKALKLTAQDAKRIEVIDDVIAEPKGGAHRDPSGAAQSIKAAIIDSLKQMQKMTPQDLREQRYARFRMLGVIHTST